MKKTMCVFIIAMIATILCGQTIIVNPNPFNNSTKISFTLRENTPITLSIYNIKGQLVKTLLDNKKENHGAHEVTWNGTDNNNKYVPNGVYFYKMTNGKFTSSRKMILLK